MSTSPGGSLAGIFPVTPTPPVPAPTAQSEPFPDLVVDSSTDLAPVFVTNAFGNIYQINIWYCASMAGAAKVLSRLNSFLKLNATLAFGYPMGGQFTGPYAQGGMVPYAVFPANPDGSIPGPPGNILSIRIGDILLEYDASITGATNATADALMLKMFRTS
jgi:hypothetical protein